MPTYDYVCNACGHALEIFQSMSESPKRKCPSCGKSKLERRIGAGAGFLFKGSGFYLTDYRSKSYADGKSAESAPAPTTTGTESAPPPTTTGAGSDTSKGETKTGDAKGDAPSKSAPAASPKPSAASSKKKPSRDD